MPTIYFFITKKYKVYTQAEDVRKKPWQKFRIRHYLVFTRNVLTLNFFFFYRIFVIFFY